MRKQATDKRATRKGTASSRKSKSLNFGGGASNPSVNAGRFVDGIVGMKPRAKTDDSKGMLFFPFGK